MPTPASPAQLCFSPRSPAPHPSRLLASRTERILASPSLCPSPCLRKRPLPLAPAPFCPPLPAGFPGKGAPWPYPTPPPPGARFGDSGKSVGPRPTPELGPPALQAPRLAHAKACCVIPTWADIPCPGRSGVGLLIILSAADPLHQPIYGPASPCWFQGGWGGGEGSARKGGEGTVNRRVKPGTSYWHSKKTTEFGAGGREGWNGGLRGSGCLGKPESRGQWDSAQAFLSLGKHAGMQADTGLCNLPAFCRAPIPWTTLGCKAGSGQAPKQSGQENWNSAQDDATEPRHSLLSEACLFGRGWLSHTTRMNGVAILEKRRPGSGKQGCLACQPPLQESPARWKGCPRSSLSCRKGPEVSQP